MERRDVDGNTGYFTRDDDGVSSKSLINMPQWRFQK